MNSFQQPVPGEPGGATWHLIENPTVGWFASKTSGWTADSFSGGLTVDFSSVVPVGTKAVRVLTFEVTTASSLYWRKGSDSNISNTPEASTEYSHMLSNVAAQSVVWLSATYTVDFAVASVDTDLYISYPVEYLL